MKILIVDDEASVLQSIMAVVKAVPGHEVKVAANGPKAIEHAAALGGVDLLITDVVMEPMDGFSLRAELQTSYPAMQTVFVSGYDLSDYAEQLVGAASLAKPVDAMALITEIGNAVTRLTAPVAVVVPEKARVAGKTTAIAVPADPSRIISSQERITRTVPQPSAAPVAATPVAATPVAAAPVAAAPVAAAPVAATPVAATPVAATPVAAAPVAAAPVAATPVAAAPVAAAPVAAAPVAAAPVAARPVAAAPVAAAPVAARPVAAAPVAAAPVAARPVAAAPVAAAPVAARPVAAVPVAAPVPRAVPVPVAAAVPVARAPVAVPRPVSAVAAAPQSAPHPLNPQPSTLNSPAAAVADAAHDPLIGVQLGDYRVQKFIGDGKWGRVYLALQISVNRRVGLKVLNPAQAEDETARTHFLNDARAKAAVQHPFIMSVFEADERNGLAFYTHEFLDGASMAERIAAAQWLDEKTALHVLKVAGEALQYLWSRNLSHSAVDAGSLRLGPDNIARMANIATAEADPAVTVESELNTVGSIIRQLTQDDKISAGLRMLLGRMTGGANPVTGWPVVLQAVKALEPKVIPMEAAKMKAADAAAMRAVEAARKAKKRGLIISASTLSVLLILLGYLIWSRFISNARRLDLQVQIPAGTYPVGAPEAGTKATLGAFEIDKYEVSINEYAKFIAWCEQNPGKEREFDHPRGDRKMPHVTQDVKTLIQKAALRGRRVFMQDADPARGTPADPGVEIDLNSPMVGVTFWDAYAYAHWRGKILDKDGIPRDLPTEEEWEAAARSSRGFKYPWGDELKPDKFNSNAGYKPLAPGGTKTSDGYNYWAPVDAFSGDVSEFKVVGLAGNVCEWVYRKEGKQEIPLLKGGSFASDPIPMWGRILKIPAEDAWYVHPAADKKGRQAADSLAFFVGDDVTPSLRSLYIGFRTVKRK
jgi:formylglycine-generating enzyme required for sulfatase activity/CheY-like chemotaxis protein